MPAPGPRIDPEELLANTCWVRALARGLLADGHRADDVVQSTLAAAVEQPPRADVPLRPWLARVARNFAFQTLRSERRRARYETAAVRRDPSALPDASAERADTFLTVVAAVRALDPLYRDVVVLRYFDGLEAAAVAERLGVPVETARTRLKRALALLRERLDAEHGGDARAWALALVPIADLPHGALAATASTTGGALVATSTKTVVLAAFLGAVLGAGVTAGFVAFPAVEDAASAPALVAAPVPQEAPGGRSAATRGEGGDNPGRAAASGRAVRPTGASLADASVQAWMDAVPVDLPPPGKGTIVGHVKTKDGVGVAGATVRATRKPPAPSSAWRGPTEPSAEDAVRDAVVYAKWRLATTRRAVTDAAGAYALSDVTDGPHWIDAWADGWEVRRAPGSDASDVKPGSSIDWIARAVIDVPVTVLLPDGSVATESVQVNWTVPEADVRSGSVMWSADAAVVRVEPGPWTLTAELGKDLRSQGARIDARVGTPTEPVTLRLEARSVVTGRVLFDPADAGWEGISVVARRRDTGATKSERVGARPPEWTFRFEDLDPGEYDVTATLADTSLVEAVVRVTGGRVVRDLEIPRLTAAQRLTVRVVGPDGLPLVADDLTFTVLQRTATGSSSGGGGRPSRLTDGSFLVPLFRDTFPQDPSRSFLDVRSKRCGAREVEFERGRTEHLEIRFDDAAVFQPTIAGADRSPLASRLRVTLGAPGAPEPRVVSRRQEILPVPPGRYVAFLSLIDANGATGRVIARVPVELRAGVNPVAIPIPELHSVKLRLPGEPAGTKVYLSAARRPQRDVASITAVVAADGTATFEDLPAGLHIAQLTSQGATREMLVRVPSSERTFAPGTVEGFTVHVDDPAGLFASSGLRSGDVVLAVDGVAIDTFQRLDETLYAARERPSVAVEVRRGEGKVTLELDPAKLWGREAHGGWWEPVLR
jgi:RNA polymerase sigma factor (sigma-70 family)